MKLALDFDGVCTADPEAFLKIVKILMENGHEVHIVTMRYQSECDKDPLMQKFAKEVTSVIPTSRRAKKPFLEALGFEIGVWVDDNPEAIFLDAEQIWGNSSPEGIVVIENPNTGETTEVVM